MLWIAPAAGAAITNVQPFNGQDGPGDPIAGDEIHDYDQVWAYVTSPTGGVVCMHVLTDKAGGCDDDDAYEKTYVPPFYAGFVPVASGNLPSGAWMLVGADASGTPVTAQSAEFFVRPCGGCQIPDLTKDNAFVAASKQLVGDINTVCGLINTASMLYRSRKMYDFAVDAMTVGPGGLNLGAVVTFSTQAYEAYAEVKDGDSLTAKLPGKLGTIADTLCDAAEKLQKLSDNTLVKAVDTWAKDPPDPNYVDVTPPPVTDYDSILGMSDWGYGAERNGLDRIRAYADSSLHAFERFQGAQATSDVTFQHVQTRAMGNDLLGYAATLRKGAAFLQGTAAQIRAEIPDAAERTVTQADLDTANVVLDRIRTSGYTAGEVSRMHAAGLDDVAIARLRVDQSLYDPSNVSPGALDERFDELATTMLNTATEAEGFGRLASVVAGRTARPIGPDFYALPGGPDQLDVDFRDQSTNGGRDPLHIEWDFGDGSTAEGPHVSHHYSGKGTYTVTESVSTDYTSDSSTKQVAAGAPNQRPVAGFTATPGQGDAPLTVHLDAASSHDPDGTIQSYEWDFGDGSPPIAAPDAAALDHTFDQPNADGYTVKLTVRDDAGDGASTTRTIVVLEPPAAPEAHDDALDARPVGVIDVMANDSDPNGDQISVSATGHPDHGTVACSALGACTYAAESGYEGGDAFTYTVRDPGGLEATATVNVTVTGPPISTEPIPADDDIVLSAGTHETVDVLANDSGKPDLGFVSATQPSHGSVSCGAEGRCTYTPQPGFDGDDGFAYTMHDGTLAQADAEVHVTVLPASSAYSVAVRGSPDPLKSGDTVNWGVGVPGHAAVLPDLAVQLSGTQTELAGSIRTAPGWSATADGAKAGAGALLGGSLSVPLVKPAATISQGTGGDGHVPIIVGDRVFAFFHHQVPTQVSCIDRRTNRRCPGYPVPIGVGTDDIPGPGVVLGTRIYLHVLASGNYSQSVPLALFCWDTATARPCGFVIVARVRGVTNRVASTPVLAGGKLWIAADTGRLYCVDPSTTTPCGSMPTGVDGVQAGIDILAHGPRVFVAGSGGQLSCIDVSVGLSCSGWALPKALPSGNFNLINRHGPDGSITGICALTTFGVARCWPDEGATTATVLDNWPALTGYYDVTEEADAGTRTLLPWIGGGAFCYDWVSLAPCVGAGYSEEGRPGLIAHDVNGDPLPAAYGVAFDGACAIGLGDPGLVFTLDPKGFAPCSGLAGDHAVDLRDQRCDGTVGNAAWDAIGLRDTRAGELGAVRLTVRDAQSGAVLATKNLVDGELDLSGIDAKAHPAISFSMAVVARPGTTAWDDFIPPRATVSWQADPEQLCFQASTPPACHVDPISLLASVGPATRSGEVALLPNGCPVAPGATAPPAPPQQSGATGLLLACSDRRVVLEDVYADRGRVQLLGVADRRFAGQKVNFVLSATGRVVATAVVGADGRFAATAPLPRGLRGSDRARYLARIGTQSSLNLKLARRMLVTRLRSAGGKVTITGRVLPPLAMKAKDRTITLQRVIACKRTANVTRFLPKANGSFSVTVPAVPGQTAAVYRLSTRVRPTAKSKGLAGTFTLPRAIDFH
jgi:PKD repeat protein/outer membrane protein assembly factor BamB